MQPRLTVGVDVAKDAVVVTCAEHSFPVQSIPQSAGPVAGLAEVAPCR